MMNAATDLSEEEAVVVGSSSESGVRSLYVLLLLWYVITTFERFSSFEGGEVFESIGVMLDF